MALFAIEDLSFSYPGCAKESLSHLSFQVKEGEFLLLCGASGCGKTTLLRHLKPALTPHGKRQGRIDYDGQDITQLDSRRAAAEIGYVMQNPDNQIVTDQVWHELAFGLENLGLPPGEIRLRVAEMVHYFGLQAIYHRETGSLSGGQKQLLNLAAIMAMHPKLLILDEPTSQLDPIAAVQFLETVSRLNRDTSTTVLLAEHRLEEVFPRADRILWMDKGRLLSDATPSQTADGLRRRGDKSLLLSLPTPARVYCATGAQGDCPLTVREGGRFLRRSFPNRIRSLTPEEYGGKRAEAVKLKQLFFRYEKNSPDVLKGLDLTLFYGELLTIVGANGSGKSTLLSILSGLRPPTGGKRIWMDGSTGKRRAKADAPSIGFLPQNPQTLFVKDTLGDDLAEMLPYLDCSAAEGERRIDEAVSLLSLQDLLNRHPYDLSGGEQQRAAMAKILLKDPQILLLDEPTKGLSPFARKELGDILRRLSGEGKAVAAVTHDIEWSARFSDRCALLFDGQFAALGEPRTFYSQNNYYTTAASRMSRGYYDYAVTDEDVIELCRSNRANSIQ